MTTVGLVPIAGILGSDQGGLGRFIFDGLNRFFNTPLLVGAVLTVVLAVVSDVLLVQIERVLTPSNRRSRQRVVNALHQLLDVVQRSGQLARRRRRAASRVSSDCWIWAWSMGITSAIAVPGGLLLGRSRRSGAATVNLANVGRAIPSFAVLVLGVIWFGLGNTPVVIALVLLAEVPPIFTFTFTGVRQVDPATVKSHGGWA